MIKVKEITKRYDKHLAVDSLSFELEKNRIYGLLGANGAGKSTTMNIITGYLAPTSGTVTIGDYDMAKNPEKAKAMIGYLPEIPPLYLDMTVDEYLMFAAELKKIKKKDRIEEIERVEKKTGLSKVSERLIRNLSKGYKQRVGLAQALLGDPEIIILDEPTVGLDPVQIIEIRNLIRSLGESHTVVLSSHILSEVQAVCDDIMIISNGHLVASDTPENLEQLMANQNSVRITVRGTLEAFDSAVESLNDVDLVEAEEDEDGFVHAIVESDKDGDFRETLFYCMAQNKLPIMELSKNIVTLEDVFIELTGSDSEYEIVEEASEDEEVEAKESEEEEEK